METVQDMRSSSSNPVSCSETSIKIYGSKEEIRARKIPETVDAPGFAPDASIPVTLYVYGVRKRWIAFLIDGFELLKKYMHQYCKLKMLCLAIVLLPLLTNIVRKNNQPKKADMLYIDICFHFQITQYGLTLPSFFKEKKSFNKSPLPIIEALPKIVFSNAGS